MEVLLKLQSSERGLAAGDRWWNEARSWVGGRFGARSRLVSRSGPHGRVVTAGGSQKERGQGAKGGMKAVTWGCFQGAQPGRGQEPQEQAES